jgi:hypothetical protein
LHGKSKKIRVWSELLGLTAGDSYKGYVAHCPEVDLVIQPTAALSSFPTRGIFTGLKTFLL